MTYEIFDLREDDFETAVGCEKDSLFVVRVECFEARSHFFLLVDALLHLENSLF